MVQSGGRRRGLIGVALVLVAVAAGGVAWWRVDGPGHGGEKPVRVTQVWTAHVGLSEYDTVLAVWSTPKWWIRVTDMGFTAYNWSDGKQAWDVTEMYFDKASGKISADGIGVVHTEQSGAEGYAGFDALHGKDARPGSYGSAYALLNRNVPRLQTPRRMTGSGKHGLVEIVAQDPNTGEDTGHFAVPAAAAAGHRQYVVQGPNGLVITVPLTNMDSAPTAFRERTT